MILQKKEVVDVLFLSTIKKTFTEREIFEVITILTAEEIDDESKGKIEIFFQKLYAKVGSWWTTIIEFSKAYNVDILVIVPILKKTDIWEKVKESFDPECNLESFNEFF